ncbi:MAG: hypothetical protein IPG43_00920 [Proteobacteria bacterium]|nr:hypothetical protein [Pseudomonadota bacterium]
MSTATAPRTAQFFGPRPANPKKNSSPGATPLFVRSDLLNKLLASRLIYVVFALVMMALDVLTGRYLQFPVLYIIPVVLSAWYREDKTTYVLAIGLPLARFFIREYVEPPYPLIFAATNYTVRAMVLTLLAWLVQRTARQTAELRARVQGLVRMCAWSRTVEFEGQWLTFEEYLKRRFGLDTTHGISPEEEKKVIAALKPSKDAASDAD